MYTRPNTMLYLWSEGHTRVYPGVYPGTTPVCFRHPRVGTQVYTRVCTLLNPTSTCTLCLKVMTGGQNYVIFWTLRPNLTSRLGTKGSSSSSSSDRATVVEGASERAPGKSNGAVLTSSAVEKAMAETFLCGVSVGKEGYSVGTSSSVGMTVTGTAKGSFVVWENFECVRVVSGAHGGCGLRNAGFAPSIASVPPYKIPKCASTRKQRRNVNARFCDTVRHTATRVLLRQSRLFHRSVCTTVFRESQLHIDCDEMPKMTPLICLPSPSVTAVLFSSFFLTQFIILALLFLSPS